MERHRSRGGPTQPQSNERVVSRILITEKSSDTYRKEIQQIESEKQARQAKVEAQQEQVKQPRQEEVEDFIEPEQPVQIEPQPETLSESHSIRGINFGVIGIGGCGGRIAEEFSKLGYVSAVIGLSLADISCVLEDQYKLKISEVGKLGSESYNSIRSLIEEVVIDSEVILLVIGLGGSCGDIINSLVSIVKTYSLPIMLLILLPPKDFDINAYKKAQQQYGQIKRLASELMLVKYNNGDIINLDEVNKTIASDFEDINIATIKSSYTNIDEIKYSKLISNKGEYLLGSSVSIDTNSKEGILILISSSQDLTPLRDKVANQDLLYGHLLKESVLPKYIFLFKEREPTINKVQPRKGSRG